MKAKVVEKIGFEKYWALEIGGLTFRLSQNEYTSFDWDAEKQELRDVDVDDEARKFMQRIADKINSC